MLMKVFLYLNKIINIGITFTLQVHDTLNYNFKNSYVCSKEKLYFFNTKGIKMKKMKIVMLLIGLILFSSELFAKNSAKDLNTTTID